MPRYPVVLDERPEERQWLGAFRAARIGARPEDRRALTRRALALDLTYQIAAGKTDPMPIGLLPIVAPAAHLRTLAALARAVQGAVRRLAAAYPQDAALRRLLPLQAEEEALFLSLWDRRACDRLTFVGRLDITWPTAAPDGPSRAMCYEQNSVAVGGFFYEPACEDFFEKTLQRTLPRRGTALPDLRRQLDLRTFLSGALREHARKIGARDGVFPLVEDFAWDTGITEVPAEARRYRAAGLPAYAADWREIDRRRGRVVWKGKPVAVLYRNFELRDLVRWEREAGPLHGFRQAFREDRVVSGLGAELDHKSLWEVLTTPPWRGRFPAAWQRLFRRHLPWTRLLFARRTTDPRGRTVDLPGWVAGRRDRLVLKPNRGCGGVDVILGPCVGGREWSRTLDRALAEPEGWVVQEWITPHAKRLPILDRRGRVRTRDFMVSYGLAAGRGGQGLIGRVCPEPVVNVSRGGALVPVFCI